jgi:uncharacterized protein YrrD
MDDVRTGMDVYCGTDKVGHVARLVADAPDSRIASIVVDRGLLHGAKLIQLEQVAEVRDRELRLNLSREQFEAADGFADQRFRGPHESWSAPPGYDPQDFLLNAEVAYGSAGGYGMSGKPGPFPPSPADPLPNLLRPTVREGTPIRAADGTKVGEVAEIGFFPDEGRLATVIMKRGLLGHERVDLPLDWVDDLDENGLILRKAAAEVEGLSPRR